MAIDALNNMGDQTDRLIDNALASYAGVAPPLGFERRVRRAVFGPPAVARFRFPKWSWAVPAAALAGFLLGIAIAPPVRSSFGIALVQLNVGLWCQQLQATWLSTSIRESLWFWFYLDGSHLLGLAVMLGPSLMLDLRLLGWLWKSEPVSKVAAKFLPITFVGFGIVISAGVLLFISHPVTYIQNINFQVKMGLIILAGANALVFHSTIDRRRAEWDMTLPPPRQARVAGLLGLVLWTCVIFAGRYMAYNISK
jgi:hypothetical protein